MPSNDSLQVSSTLGKLVERFNTFESLQQAALRSVQQEVATLENMLSRDLDATRHLTDNKLENLKSSMESIKTKQDQTSHLIDVLESKVSNLDYRLTTVETSSNNTSKRLINLAQRLETVETRPYHKTHQAVNQLKTIVITALVTGTIAWLISTLESLL